MSHARSCATLMVNKSREIQKVRSIAKKTFNQRKVDFSELTQKLEDLLLMFKQEQVLNRQIIIYPVFHEDGVCSEDFIKNEPKSKAALLPMHFIYYPESKFTTEHYQSIRKATLKQHPSEDI